MSKSLSNGTLSLRFMQNAERAKDNPEVKPNQVILADDAEWHIPKNVWDAWTSAGSAATNYSELAAVSESSYLPFLFHTEDEASPPFNGRRSFVKGKAVAPQPEPAQSSDPPQQPATKLDPVSVSGRPDAGHSHSDRALIKPKRERKPVSISGFRSSPSSTASTSRPLGKKPTLPASDLIHQNADVGVDLGATRRAARDRTGFIKPADVDAPPRRSAALSIVESARTRAEQKKRSIDSSKQPVDVPEESPGKKRKR